MPSVSRRRLGGVSSTVLGGLTCLVLAAGAAASITQSSGFGHRGVLNFGNGKVMALAPQRGGGVIVVGSSGSRMLIARVTAGGRVQRRSNGGSGVANAVLVQPDGKILVAGTTAPNGHASVAGDMVVERFKAGGAPDRSFGHGGVVHLRAAVANALALGPHGTIVAAGSIPGRDGSPRVAVARLRSNGAADRSLGSGGVAVIDLGPFSEANAVAVQRDGKIVFGGDYGIQVVNAVIGRVGSRGGLDRRFGHGGTYTYLHPHGGGASTFQALALAGGKIVAAGGDDQSTGPHALVVRLTGGGGTDRGFAGGAFTSPAAQSVIANGFLGIHAMSVTRGGEILAAGVSAAGAANYATLWAITARGGLDGREGSGGVSRTLAGGALGAAYQGLALDGRGNAFAGGETLGLSQTQTQGFVTRYVLRGIR